MFTDLASRNRNSVAALSALAQDKLARHDWNGAHAIAEEIRKLSDKSHTTDQISGAAFSALNANPRNATAFAFLGSIELATQNPSYAEQNFLDDIFGYKALADLYTRQKKYDAAYRHPSLGVAPATQKFRAAP